MTQRACAFTGAEYSANPVVTGQSVLITVELHDFSHGYWSGFAHVSLVGLTHDEMGGNDATWENVKSATWNEVTNMEWGD